VGERRPSRSINSRKLIKMALSVGSKAPAFSCIAHTGATVALSDYVGKKVLLWFYPRACTGG